MPAVTIRNLSAETHRALKLRAAATIDDLLLTIGVSIGGVELQSPASASAKSA